MSTPEIQEIRDLVETYYDFQKLRIMTGNRLTRYCTKCKKKVNELKVEDEATLVLHSCECTTINAEELPPDYWTAESKKIKTYYEELIRAEKTIYDALKEWVETQPIYARYLSRIVGFGPALSSGIIAWIENPAWYATRSALWAYAGLSTELYCETCKTLVDEKSPTGITEHAGHKTYRRAQKRIKGRKSNWNNRLRTHCWKIGKQFVISKDAGYKRFYYDEKRKYAARSDLQTGKGHKGHIDNMARRKTVKLFLSHLWEEWRTMNGLPTEAPYAQALLGHTGIIPPFYDKPQHVHPKHLDEHWSCCPTEEPSEP